MIFDAARQVSNLTDLFMKKIRQATVRPVQTLASSRKIRGRSSLIASMSVLLLLAACGGGGGTGAGVASGGVTTITGSSGDGPIIGGALTVTDGNGNAVTTTPANPVTDATAHYSFTISPTTPLPITVTITGGTDSVTGAAQDFTLTNISAAPLAASGTVDLNINPLSTLIAASVRAKGAVNATSLAAATTNVLNTMGFGLPAGFDPQSTKVGAANVASVVKANEAAAELIRRAGVATGKSMANTILAIAEDLTDGVLDGKVAAGVTATQATVKTAGVILTKQAEISAAVLAGKLTITDKNGVTKVTAANMTSKLNAAILITQPNATGNAADVSKVKVTQKFIDQTINAVSQSNVLLGGGNARLNNVEATIHALSATAAPSAQQAADIIIALNNAQSAINTATGNAQSGAGTVTTTTTNSAPVFTGTPAISGTVAVGNTLSLTATTATDADGNPVSYSYQWNANGAVIAGATAATYVVQVGDSGKTITAVITANDGQNAANSATSVGTVGIIVPDTTAPTQTFSSLAFSADTGSSNTDFITKTAVQTITATLSSTLAFGDIVNGSLDNGNTWTDITAKVTSTTLTWNGITLTTSSTLKLKMTDKAGNIGAGAIASQAYVLDTTAPTITSKFPAASATGVAVNAGVNITFSELMNTATITTSSFTVTAAGSAIAGGISHNAGNLETFTPNASMVSNTAHTVAVTNSITDLAGNALTAANWSFTTTAVQTFTVGGTVTGLGAGKTVVLQDNGGDNLTVNTNVGFTFSTKVANNGSYAVTVLTPPSGQGCTISKGNATITANVSNVAVTCFVVVPLNDTGITTWGNATVNNLTAADVAFPGQDADHGRDAQATGVVAGGLTKVGGSSLSNGFDFTKLASDGVTTISPATVYTTTGWDCVQDNHTGLMWEVKTKAGAGGLRDANNNYSWYNTNAATNGGNAGTANGGTCTGGTGCDTKKYVADVNALSAASRICGFTDWRLPTREELLSILEYSGVAPRIDKAYFSDATGQTFWTSSPSAASAADAWNVNESFGTVAVAPKRTIAVIRLVRGGN